MHLAERGFQFLLLAAVLAIAGQWGDDPGLRMLWVWPAGLVIFGLCFEHWHAARTGLRVALEGPNVLLLGQPQSLSFVFEQTSTRVLPLQFAPAVPAGFELLGEPVTLLLPAGATLRWPRDITALRLGAHDWPPLPVRLAGRLRLAWWSRTLSLTHGITVAPDTRSLASRVRGTHAGANARLRPGRGAELLQLRDYLPGDPKAHIDWKTTARLRRLTTREYAEDQHLDILLAIDAGRLSRARAGPLDRLGLYANLAARFAQHAVQRDDRVGLLVYAERPLAVCAPDRGVRAVAAIRQQLMQLASQRGESAPLLAALRMRTFLRQRTLIVLLTDLEDATAGVALRSAVLTLMPPHVALLAGVRSEELGAMVQQPARDWRDPWVALAARAALQRTALQHAQLRAIGAPVIYAPQQQLEQAVFDEYEVLRQRRLRPQRHTDAQR